MLSDSIPSRSARVMAARRIRPLVKAARRFAARLARRAICLHHTRSTAYTVSPLQAYAVCAKLTSSSLRCKCGTNPARKVATMITTKTRASETASVQLATMKAIVENQYGTSEVLELQDIARHDIGEGEVLVRVRAAGVNPADWAIVGGLPYIARPLYGMGKPKNPVRGTDVAGEVEAVGAGVTRIRPGDQVFGWSGRHGGAFEE